MEKEIQKKQDGFIIVRRDVLESKDLTPSEKLVYARICGFGDFFEAARNTSDALGISESKVQKAKQNLCRLGFVEEITNTGHGKRYRAIYDIKTRQKSQSDSPKKLVCLANLANQTSQIDQHKVKGKEKESKTTIAKAIVGKTLAQTNQESDKPEVFGNVAINDLFEQWQTNFGFAIKTKQTLNRRAAHRLIKNFGKEPVLKSFQWVAVAQEDRFAPKIANFMDLWDKWNDLILYVKRLRSEERAKSSVIEDLGDGAQHIKNSDGSGVILI